MWFAQITGGAMVDVAFDITGHPAVLAPTTALVRQLGRVILLGDTPTPSRQHLGPRVVADSVSVLGVHASAAPDVPQPARPVDAAGDDRRCSSTGSPPVAWTWTPWSRTGSPRVRRPRSTKPCARTGQASSASFSTGRSVSA